MSHRGSNISLALFDPQNCTHLSSCKAMTAPEASSRGSWLVRLVVVLCACFVAFFVVLYADDFVHGKRSEAEIAAAAAARNASSAS